MPSHANFLARLETTTRATGAVPAFEAADGKVTCARLVDTTQRNGD